MFFFFHFFSLEVCQVFAETCVIFFPLCQLVVSVKFSHSSIRTIGPTLPHRSYADLTAMRSARSGSSECV
uniref:Secreted protein n=1 Tax=Anopheles dirus TaxID=7168 RepID=A0A182NX74_9DIPT